jgi:hypothetical protein
MLQVVADDQHVGALLELDAASIRRATSSSFGASAVE